MQLPEPLIHALQHVKGFDEKAFRQVHGSGEQVTSIRLNTQKAGSPGQDNNIPHSLFGHQSEPVPWSSSGYYLPERPSFTSDPSFHAGAYYVQEASSMFLEEVLRQTVDLLQPLKVLDLCAAPGGKSTLLQSVISGDSLLVSNEVIKARVNILSENITKWGGANVIVTNNDPANFQRLPGYFDLVVVDAPCSGSGLFRKDPEAVREWSEHNVALCGQRQQRILADILPSLKPGGVLIYATCSYSEAEDEAIADWLTGGHGMTSIALRLNPVWNIVETASPLHNAYGYRFFPDKVRGEGFFIAAFIKEQGVDGLRDKYRSTKQKDNTGNLTVKEAEVLKPYLKNADEFFFIKQNDEVIAMPLHLEDDLAAIRSSLYIKKAGIKMGSIIRGELIPDHELAISTIINPDLRSVRVDKATALQYLRREEIKTESELRGWVLLRYGHLALGWVKILPNRINNYYPAAWRILNK